MATDIKIRGYHTDLYQHVNNARYLEFLEEARWQLIDDYVGLDTFFTRDYFFIVVNINISYKAPAAANHIVSADAALLKTGSKSAVFRQRVFNKTIGKLSAEADVTFVITDTNGTVLPLSGDLLTLLRKIPATQ